MTDATNQDPFAEIITKHGSELPPPQAEAPIDPFSEIAHKERKDEENRYVNAIKNTAISLNKFGAPALGLGMVEAGVAGVADLANLAGSGALSLGKAALAKTAGLDFVDTFTEEFNKTYQGVQSAVPYMPETESGKMVMEGMGKVIGTAMEAIGTLGVLDQKVKTAAYKKLGGNVSPEAELKLEGAAFGGSQALATLATLMVGGKGKTAPHPDAPKAGSLKGAETDIYTKWKDPNYVSQWASEKYPETMKNLQASSVGRTIRENYSNIDVYDSVHKSLNSELGLTSTSGLTVTQKMLILMDKLDVSRTIPFNEKLMITDSALKQLDMLNRIANIDKTPEQLVQARIIRPQLSLKDTIERQSGIKAEPTPADTAQRAKDFKAALSEKQGWVIDPVTQVERQLTAGEYLDIQARNNLPPPPTKTAKQIVDEATIKPDATVQAFVDELTGVTNRDKPITQAEIKAAFSEPSGIYVIDPTKGQVERQLSIGDYFEMVRKGQATLPPKRKTKTTNNASGESAASAEAINRMTQEKGKGIKKFIIDPKRNEITPLNTVDRVDQRAYKDKAIIQQDAQGKLTIIENNSGMVNEGVLGRGQQLIKDMPDNVETLITKPIRDFHTSLGKRIDERVTQNQAKVDAYQGWKFEVGQRIKSNKSSKVYEITAKSWDTRNNAPMYMYKSADGERGSFRAETSDKGKGAHDHFTVMTGPKGKPGGKQSGVFLNDTPEAIALNKKAAEQLAKKSGNITAAGMLSPERYKQIVNSMEQGRLHDPNRIISLPEHVLEGTQKRLFDTSGPMKRSLESFGKAGQEVKDRFNLIKGASGKAQFDYKQYANNIYKGLSHNEIIQMDRLVRARRVIAIDQYKGTGTHQHVAGITGIEAEAFKNNMIAEIGAETFGKIDQAANKYFRAYQDQLRLLHDEGLVSDQGFVSMLNLEYTPTEALKFIDPEVSFTFHGKTITVHDSGIASLGRGTQSIVNMNSKDLLAEHVLRVQTRIMKNAANKQLLDFSKTVPNDFIKPADVTRWDGIGKAMDVGKPPAGYQRIDAMVNGKQEPMWMRDDMAEQWVQSETVMSAEFASFLNVASGSALVKTLATTVNPGFALVNIPRDLQHIWLATSEYSSHLPLYGLQMGVDVATVAKDAIFRTGRYKDFIKEGGSQEYLSQQGPAVFMGNQIHKMTSAWQPVFNALTYLGTTSEVITRLALRERAIKNGKQPWEASAAAREYLDFSNGGSWVKGFDTVIPYLNAATQATYTVGKQAVRTPGRFSWQQTQVLGTALGLTAAAMTMNEDAWKQLPTDAKVKNFVIAPKDMFIVDPQGNKRYVYYTLPLDSASVPANALAIALNERHNFGKIPSGLVMDSLKSMTPILQGMPIPTLSASASYINNIDFWRNDQIWKGPKVNPQDEVVPNFKPNATPEIYKMLGESTGLSPERSRAAIKQLAPSNPYTDVIGGQFQEYLEGMSDYDKSKMTMQLISENPILKRVVHLTHPFTAEVEALEQAEMDRNSVKGKQSSAIGEMVFRDAQKLGNGKDEFKSWITTQPPLERERLTNQFVSTLVVDKVFRQLKASDGIPSQIWWRASSHLDSTARADVFYWQWVTRSQPERQQMLRAAQALSNNGLSYWSDDFIRGFAMQRKQYGDEQR